MIKRVTLILFLSLHILLLGETTKEEFISKARHNLLLHSWLEISGKLFFRPIDEDVIKKEITIKAQMHFEELTFQVNIDKKEKIRLYQKFGNIYHYKELLNNLEKQNSFVQMGLNITDISLSFMYWDLVKELEDKRIGLLKCRVFLMRNPDDVNFARVYISEKYFAPLRVEWLINLQKEPYKQLQFKSFSEENDIWAPREIQLSNKKGRISIKSDNFNAGKGDAPQTFFQ